MWPVVAIVLLWLGFASSHLALSSLPVRQRLVARIGEPRFRGLYSLVAFAFFVPLVRIYFTHKHAGPVLWTVPPHPAVRWTVYAGMSVAFILLVASFVQPSPASVGGGNTRPRGILLVTRHPLLMALFVFGVVHLIPNGGASDVAYFAGFALFPLVGAWHQDRRKLATMPEFRAFYERTPFFPFTGRQTGRGLHELPIVAVGIALLVTITIRYFHGRLFGG